MNISEKVQELLKSKKGMGQNEIANEIGISPAVLSKLCNGNSKAPAADTVLAIAKYFNVSTDWLVGLSSIPTTYWECKSNDELFEKDVAEAICHLMETLTSVMDINTNEICAQISNDNLNNWLSAIRERIVADIQSTTKIILKAQGDNKEV